MAASPFFTPKGPAKIPMAKLSFTHTQLAGLCLIALLFSFSCGRDTASIQKNDNNLRLVGTWILQSRVDGEIEIPARERQLEFIFLGKDLFRARYRADSTHDWIGVGEGSFRYDPPYLSLYWDSGATATLLLAEEAAERIRFHHGRNLVPAVNQEPDEIFVRKKVDAATSGPKS